MLDMRLMYKYSAQVKRIRFLTYIIYIKHIIHGYRIIHVSCPIRMKHKPNIPENEINCTFVMTKVYCFAKFFTIDNQVNNVILYFIFYGF